MGCIPSKQKEDADVTVGLLPMENENERNPHPVQRYDVSSSEDSTHQLTADRRNGSQFLNNLVEKNIQDLIDVPSLAYTLYGTNSPYNYCEDYNSVIASVRIVDGILNVSVPPVAEVGENVESLLQEPSAVDYALIALCEKTLTFKADSMKIVKCSLVVDF